MKVVSYTLMYKCLAWLKKKSSEANFAEWLTAGFTLVIAGATIVYTCYARRQWQAMGDQETTMQDQLNEMGETLNLQRQIAAVQKGGASISLYSLSVFHDESGIHAAVRFFNNGKNYDAEQIKTFVQVGFHSCPTVAPSGSEGFEDAVPTTLPPSSGPNPVSAHTQDDAIFKPPLAVTGSEIYISSAVRYTDYWEVTRNPRPFCNSIPYDTLMKSAPGLKGEVGCGIDANNTPTCHPPKR